MITHALMKLKRAERVQLKVTTEYWSPCSRLWRPVVIIINRASPNNSTTVTLCNWKKLIKVVARALKLDDIVKSTFKCTAHEDNQACQTLANLEPGRQTARSKFFDNKVHWFRSMLNEHITVTRVDTKLQLADIYTKALARDDFERLRRMSWILTLAAPELVLHHAVHLRGPHSSSQIANLIWLELQDPMM